MFQIEQREYYQKYGGMMEDEEKIEGKEDKEKIEEKEDEEKIESKEDEEMSEDKENEELREKRNVNPKTIQYGTQSRVTQLQDRLHHLLKCFHRQSSNKQSISH